MSLVKAVCDREILGFIGEPSCIKAMEAAMKMSLKEKTRNIITRP